jgi:hypothetical protein
MVMAIRADLLGSLMYGVGVRNVHHERHEAVTEISLQMIGVSLLAYRTEHAKSLETRTFVVPQPIPVETPVTTTSLLFSIAFLLR